VGVSALARLAGAIGLLAAVACSRERPRAAADSSAAASAAPRSSAGAATPDCPATGHWSGCQVRKRLEQAGVAPQTGAPADDLPALGPDPILYTVGTSRLAVYLFADSAARARAAHGLDSTKFVGPASALTMRGETTAIQNDNLLALLFSQREQQRERVGDALTAGAPQPERH
jgi:hypothetical protein